MTAVPDASIILTALMPSQFRADARRLLKALSKELAAPPVLRQEVFNGVHKGERRRNITAAGADHVLAEFEALDIQYFDSPSWVPRAFEVARRYRQPNIFDALYIVCAEDLGVELWTADRRFVRSFGAQRPPRLRLCPEDVSPAT